MELFSEMYLSVFFFNPFFFLLTFLLILSKDESLSVSMDEKSLVMKESFVEDELELSSEDDEKDDEGDPVRWR